MNSGFERSDHLYAGKRDGNFGPLVVSNSYRSSAAGGDCADLMLVSSDQVVYRVHCAQISRVSTNAFAGFLSDDNRSITLSEPASVVDILVHVIYGTPCAHLSPSLETTEATLDALVKYGIPPHLHASPDQPMYQLLLVHAPHRPIDTYALAGHHRLEDAAVAISEHLLACNLSRLPEELLVKIGPVYTRRLYLLHHRRLSELKTILHPPPAQHPPTDVCGESTPPARMRLTEAWALAAARLAWNASPDISTDTLRTLSEITVNCDSCREALRVRVGEVCEVWAAVKRTI